jgi:hypothetical protein
MRRIDAGPDVWNAAAARTFECSTAISRAAASTKFWFDPCPFRNSMRLNPWRASDEPTSVR